MILVVDHAHSPVCGIHDLGLRIVDNLARACLDVVHADCGSVGEYLAVLDEQQPDAVIVNYRADLMPWIRHGLRHDEVGILHNFEPGSLDAHVNLLCRSGFARVLVLDQTMRPSDPRAVVAHRPIPDTVPRRRHDGPPAVGSFGFAFPHKRFDIVAGECASLGHDVVFNLHMPEAFFNGAEGAPIYTDAILRACQTTIGPAPVELHYSHEHLAERELVARLACNDVNALLYEPGQPDAGISSALDYLIAARRPILVSDAFMFHHVTDHAAVYPQVRLVDILDDYDTWQRHADVLYDETAGAFATDVSPIL